MIINIRNTVSGSIAILIVLLHVLSSIEDTAGCYIVDCPLAGKRSEATVAETSQSRQHPGRNVSISLNHNA